VDCWPQFLTKNHKILFGRQRGNSIFILGSWFRSFL